MTSKDDGPRKPCPFCAEPIRIEAVKCRYCQSDLPQPVETTTSNVVSELLIPTKVEDLPDATKSKIPGCIAKIFLAYISIGIVIIVFNGLHQEKEPIRANAQGVSSSQESSSLPGIGKQGIVTSDCGGAVDDEAWDKLNEAAVANDKMGVQQLLEQRKVLMLHQGEKFLVVDLSFTALKVRMLDGPHSGEVCWVSANLVKRLN